MGWPPLSEVQPGPDPYVLTLSLSCWQSCRETVKKTRASLSQGITDSTLCTWLTSRRCVPHSLGERRAALRAAQRARATLGGAGALLRPLSGSILTTWPRGCAVRRLLLGGSSRQESIRWGQAWDHRVGEGRLGAGAHLGGIGLQGMQLVHGEAELVEVDVDVDQEVRRQGGGELKHVQVSANYIDTV